MTNANACKCAAIQNKIGPKSQLQHVMDHLRLKGNISQLEADTLYRVNRLASRIHELRKHGLEIQPERRKDLTGKSYVRYHLV